MRSPGLGHIRELIRRTYIYPSFLFDGTSDESSIAACSLALVPMFPVMFLRCAQVVDGFLDPRPLTLFSKRRVLTETTVDVRIRSTTTSEPALLVAFGPTEEEANRVGCRTRDGQECHNAGPEPPRHRACLPRSESDRVFIPVSLPQPYA